MFTGAAFLWGLLAGAVPVIVHLTFQRRSRAMKWPTLRFLSESKKRIAHRKRIQELLLLLLRTALVMLLAMALAGPVLRGIRSGSGSAVVIVLDNSMSMSCVHNDVTRFSTAKDIVFELLRVLSRRDNCALLLSDGTQDEAVSLLGPNKRAIFNAVRSLEPGASRGALEARIAEASEMLRTSRAAARELIIVTDLQKTAFPESITLPQNPHLTGILFCDCSRPNFVNAAVTFVDVEAAPETGRASVGCRIASFSDTSISETVSFSIEPAPSVGAYVGKHRGAVRSRGANLEKRTERRVELPPHGETSLTFDVRLDAPGAYLGCIRIFDDSVSADNVRYFRMNVPDSISVLILDGSADGAGSETVFFVRHALEASSEEGRSPFNVRVEGVGSLSELDLAETDVAVLAEFSRLTPEGAKRVKRFAASGGGLVIFPPSAASASSFAAALAPKAGEDSILPAEIGRIAGTPPVKSAARKKSEAGTSWTPDPASVDYSHKAMIPFRGLDVTAFTAIRVRRAYLLQPSAGRSLIGFGPMPGGGGRVPSAAFLAAGEYGRGSVFLFALPADIEWSNFPVRSLFLPLVRSICRASAGAEKFQRDFVVGSSPTVRIRTAGGGGKRVRLMGPSGVLVDAVPAPDESARKETEPKKGESSARVHSFLFPRLEQPGPYGLEVDGEAADWVVVNTDPAESDLAIVTSDEALNTLGKLADEVFVLSSPSEMKSAFVRMRSGLALAGPLLAFVILIALVECFVANRVAPGRMQEKAE